MQNKKICYNKLMINIKQIIRIIYTRIVKPIAFLFDPEKTHNQAIKLGAKLGSFSFGKKMIKSVCYYKNERLKQKICGIEFENPIGLSAGFDKNAELTSIYEQIGFGFAEIGTITFRPYKGNEPPRLLRLPKSKAILVNYGLKNDGSNIIIDRIKNAEKNSCKLGISIGRTNAQDTATAEGGIADYIQCVRKVKESNVGDFYTINISCPNMSGTESFIEPKHLDELLKAIRELDIAKPILLKLPISIEWNQLEKLLEVATSWSIDGVIIGNLNKDRENPEIIDEIQSSITKGGISGKPTFTRSNELIHKTYEKFGEKLVIIGVGGIFSGKDAYEKIKHGATLVALITGMIYNGPQLIGEINEELVKLLDKDKFENIREAIGAYHKK